MPRAGSLLAGRFLIERELGRGGMGAVFAARDQRMHGRRVAIKCLFATPSSAREGTARMLREAAAAFDHPHVVRIYDVDVEQQFLVMERLEGMSLATRLGQGSFTVHEACGLMMQALEGLAAVHARGLVHRDLKPDNLFLADDGKGRVVLKLLDFGIVKQTAPQRAEWTATEAGMVVGTPAYMAPEQWTGGAVDARADVYAIAAVLYELLTLRHPLRGVAGRRGAADFVPVPPSQFREGLSPALVDVIMKALRVAPEARYQSAQELLDALRRTGGADVARKRRGFMPLALGLVAVVGLASGGLVLEGKQERVSIPPPLPSPAPVAARRAPAEDEIPAELLGLDEETAQRILKQVGFTTAGHLANIVEELEQLDLSDEERAQKKK